MSSRQGCQSVFCCRLFCACGGCLEHVEASQLRNWVRVPCFQVQEDIFLAGRERRSDLSIILGVMLVSDGLALVLRLGLT